jgi:hypothetical protein
MNLNFKKTEEFEIEFLGIGLKMQPSVVNLKRKRVTKSREREPPPIGQRRAVAILVKVKSSDNSAANRFGTFQSTNSRPERRLSLQLVYTHPIRSFA